LGQGGRKEAGADDLEAGARGDESDHGWDCHAARDGRGDLKADGVGGLTHAEA